MTLQRGFDLPQQHRRPGDVPIVSSSGVTGRHREARVHAPGVVTGRYGTIGEVFFLTEDFWPLNTTLWVKDFKGNDPRFVSYLLRTVDYGVYSDKSSVPGVNRNHLHATLVPLPPPHEQVVMAAALGALDDKIELNRRTCTTLERIADAVFRALFVDFEGEDELVDSELGPIPHGWCVAALDDVIEFVNGGAFTKFATGEGRMILRIADLRSGPGPATKYGDLDVARRNEALLGDVLFAWSGTLDVWIWSGPAAIVNQHIFNCFPRDGLPRWFAYRQIRSFLPFFRSAAADKATTMGHITRDHLRRALLARPPAAVVRDADDLLGPVSDAWLTSQREIAALEALRDLLLPKLISGEIRIRAEESAAT